MMLCQMACISAWSAPSLEPVELTQVVKDSAVRNNLAAITGAVLCLRNSFFHILEGRKSQLIALLERMKSDPRQSCLTQVALVPIDERSFQDWCVVLEPEQIELVTPTCGFDCAHCPQASICDVAGYRSAVEAGEFTVSETARVMMDWFFRIHLRELGEPVVPTE